MTNLSFNSRRIVVGVVMVIALMSLLNYLCSWSFFGELDKKVMIGCYVVLAVVMIRWLPTRVEWDEHRKQKDVS
jgi:uncharacterized membrane protein